MTRTTDNANFVFLQEDQDGSQGLGKRKRVKLSSNTKGIYILFFSCVKNCLITKSTWLAGHQSCLKRELCYWMCSVWRQCC